MIRMAVIGAGADSSRCHGPALKRVAAESPAEVEVAARRWETPIAGGGPAQSCEARIR